MTRKLQPVTAKTARALTIVKRHGPIGGNIFAGHMWPDAPAWKKVSKAGNYGSRSGAGMPRAAGSFLAVLAKRGLVVRLYPHGDYRSYTPKYVLTAKGQQVLDAGLYPIEL